MTCRKRRRLDTTTLDITGMGILDTSITISITVKKKKSLKSYRFKNTWLLAHTCKLIVFNEAVREI